MPLGEGQIDITAVVQAAHGAGVKWFFIEDESAAPEAGVWKSLLCIKSLPW